MTDETVDSPWGKMPFELLHTPTYLQQQHEKTTVSPYVENASVMVILHNIILRGLNSIYIQAPYVAPDDYSDFINYCYCWYQLIDGHHRAEEERFFPELEKCTGEKGLMDANVEQHHAFHDGLEAYRLYLDSVREKPDTFSSTKLVSIIEIFAPTLCRHMAEEIPTLLALDRFGDTLPIIAMGRAEGGKSNAEMERTGSLMFFLMNHDRAFEGGMWASWPPIPPPIRWTMVRVFGSWNKGWWKFASCDFDGYPKRLVGGAEIVEKRWV